MSINVSSGEIVIIKEGAPIPAKKTVTLTIAADHQGIGELPVKVGSVEHVVTLGGIKKGTATFNAEFSLNEDELSVVLSGGGAKTNETFKVK